MRGSRKFCQMGSNYDKFFFSIFFLVDKGREDLNTTTLSWGLTFNAGLVALRFSGNLDQYC